MSNLALIRTIWGDPARLLSQSIRGAIVPKEGNMLVVSDFSSIESRVLGWMSNCTRINQLFAQGKDTYKDFACELFHVPYDQVTKKQRKFAKPPVLGCGYFLGAKGLMAYAEGYGVDMDPEEAQHAVDLYRGTYREVPEMWEGLMAMVERAVKAPGTWWSGYRVTVGTYRDMLMILLPSGRYLHYYLPLWEDVEMPWTDRNGHAVYKPGFTYMGVNQYTTKWERVSAHAGKVTENIVQAVARDLLAEALMAAEELWLNPVGHVHDEIICEVSVVAAEKALEDLTTIMSKPPTWAPDLLLGAAGWTGGRYRKD